MQPYSHARQRATRNTKVRSYLLRGIIRCAECGRTYAGATVRRGDKTYSYYNCGAKWSSGKHGLRCPSRPVSAAGIENEVFRMVVGFLSGSEGIETEMRRRSAIMESSQASLLRELEGLVRQEHDERDAEGRAFRLASRGTVNEAVYEEEIGLIHTRQRWLADQRQLVQAQIVDLDRYRLDPATIGIMRKRLDIRLSGATVEDRRFVLEAVGARVIMHDDRTWDLELQVPRDSEPLEERVLPIVNSRPESISPVNAT